MHRILLQLGPVTIFSYGALLVLGFLTATWLATRDARRWPPERVALNPSQFVDVACLAMLSGVLGARIFFVIQYWSVYVRYPHEMLAIWHGGLVWYGGFLGGLLSIWVYVRLHRVPLLRALDQFVPYVALAHSIGRIGCFLNGCCYGKPTTAWFGVTFPGREGPVIPTQLIESGLLLLLFLALRRLQEGRALERPGGIFSSYLIGYGVLRFFVEFLRGDQVRGPSGLTLQQFLSLGLVVAGLILFAALARRQGAKPHLS